MKNILVLILGIFLLVGLTGCGNKDIKLLGKYTSGDEGDSEYFYYEFTKKGNKKGTCEFYEYIEGYGSSNVTYEYEFEKIDNETYSILLKNIENDITIIASYNITNDTIVDNIKTYEKIN